MNWKQLLIVFVFYLIGMWIGGWVNSVLGLSSGGDFLSTLLFAFVPFTCFWLIYQKWGKRFAGGQ